MKDKSDIQTLDAFLSPRRGRPKTVTAKTSAQRKADQRARDREVFLWSGDFGDVSTVGLIAELSQAVNSGSVVLVSQINTELLRRTRLLAKIAITD